MCLAALLAASTVPLPVDPLAHDGLYKRRHNVLPAQDWQSCQQQKASLDHKPNKTEHQEADC